MLKRTKIVATMGPACSDIEVLKKVIKAGVNVVRLNFSHGTAESHSNQLENVRKCRQEFDAQLGVMADLQGPKIRIGSFKNEKVLLKEGQKFTLDTSLDEEAGDETQVRVNYQSLTTDLKPNDSLLLADGLIEMKVLSIKGSCVNCKVVIGGELSNRKGINRRGGGLSANALTEKDEKDLIHAVEMGVDYIALSFVSSAEDIRYARKLIDKAGGNCSLIAKIERSEAVDKIDEIIKESDGVMVARGDLALEIGEAEVPAAQKHIINRARALDRPVITATQMMESMIHQSMPTRAEVSDVANAVLDTTDAVMLSAETATGNHPVETVKAMARACLGAEKSPMVQTSGHRVECEFERVDEAIAMATMYTANHIPIKAILCLTETGSTPLWMSRIRSKIPIFALSRHGETLRKSSLYRGVYPIEFDVTKLDRAEVNTAAVACLQKFGYIQEGDWVILTKGDYVGVQGGTNTMKIIEVGRTGY